MAVYGDYNTEVYNTGLCGTGVCNTGLCESGGCGNDCFDIVKSNKTYTVPCTRNVREPHIVNVPKTKAVTVNKQVPYIDYETQTKQVPYRYVDRQTVTRKVPTCKVFPIVKNVCTNVPVRSRTLGIGRSCYVKKKCPRTVYVRKKCCVPRQFCQSVQRVGWKTVQVNVPVQKFRNETEVKYKTENVPTVRYRTRAVTKMVNKTVPVYNIVKKPPPPVQPPTDVVVHTVPAPEEQIVLPSVTVYGASAPAYAGAAHAPAISFHAANTNHAGRIPMNEYVEARPAGYSEVAIDIDYGHHMRHIDHGVVADFNRIDKDRDGQLNYEEVKFDIADTNKNGVLDYNEYATGYGSQNVVAYGRGLASGHGTQNAVMYDGGVANAGHVVGYGNHATEVGTARIG